MRSKVKNNFDILFLQSVWLFRETASGPDFKEGIGKCCCTWLLVSNSNNDLLSALAFFPWNRGGEQTNSIRICLGKLTSYSLFICSELLSKLQAAVENVARIKYALDQDTDDWSEPHSPRSPDSVKSFSRQSSRRSRASSVSSVDTAVAEERVSSFTDLFMFLRV